MSKQVKQVKQTDERLQLMATNNMLYDCDENMSCIIQKEFKQNRFVSPDIENYKESNQLICNFDTLMCDEFVNPTNSYINLSLKVNSTNKPTDDWQLQTANYSFGNNFDVITPSRDGVGINYQLYKTYFKTGGSVLNLFNTVELVSPSGEIIFREKYFNQNRTARQYEISQERMNTINAMMGGLCYDNKQQKYIFPSFSTNRYTNFCIPLAEISSFFNQSRPIPACVLKDCILRITLEKPDTCVILNRIGVGFPSYQTDFAQGFSMDIKNVYMNYQTVKAFDSIYKIVKHNSIQIPYKTKFTMRHRILASTATLNVPITAAQVLNVQLKIIRADYSLYDSQEIFDGPPPVPIYNINQRSPMYANDFCELSDGFDLDTAILPSFKIKVGDYYYPQFDARTIEDYYAMTMEALNPMSSGGSCNDIKLDYNKSSIGCVNYNDFSYPLSTYVSPTVQAVEYGLSSGGNIYAFDLRRSKDLGSGITVNSQRNLSVMLSNIDAIDNNSRFDMFITVEYLQILEYKDGKMTIMK
tara:strand:+ start:1974 stop:3554 length:1581 start_codon:yes stop_codon:yes gene_type:complete